MKVLKPNKNKLTQGYSDKHKGYDHSGNGDQNYYSSIYGKVVQAKNSETKNWTNNKALTTADYGNYIKIKGEVDGKTVYQLGAHFKQGTVLPIGTEVKTGQVIAQIGNTGNSTAPHSHTEYRDENNHNFPVEFVDEQAQNPTMDKAKEQIIIDTYKAVTGEYPNDDEKKATLQKNENSVELIEDLLRGDGRSKVRWLAEWGVEDNNQDFLTTIEAYKDTFYKLKEILKLPVGANNEDVLGRVAGLVESLREAKEALVPKVVYKLQDKDFTKVFSISNLIIIMEK
jgi:hypothetical protein